MRFRARDRRLSENLRKSAKSVDQEIAYRGRIAPTPTGFLHLGHAATFWTAQERARARNGDLILRVEDLDVTRCRQEFREALIEDLRWFGLDWSEGPYVQSERRSLCAEALEKLRAGGFVYPCHCSRKDVLGAAVAPHDEEELIYPGTCRPPAGAISDSLISGVNWRFRVPDGETLKYVDLRLGSQSAIAGEHFGDFIVWRRDDVPAYQLAVTVDDAAMAITEVVRGEDLLLSTFRQLLLYRALNLSPPAFYHTALITDESGNRLAKRNAALSLRALREKGAAAEDLRADILRSTARADAALAPRSCSPQTQGAPPRSPQK